MLEFEGPPLDPAIVSAQPMKPLQIVDMPQMVCPPGTSLWPDPGVDAMMQYPLCVLHRRLMSVCHWDEALGVLMLFLFQFAQSPASHNPTPFLFNLSPRKYVAII